jgi:hypothetical protein
MYTSMGRKENDERDFTGGVYDKILYSIAIFAETCTNKPMEKVSSTTKFRKKSHYHPTVEFSVHQKIQVSFQFSKRFVLTFQRRCSSLQVGFYG